MKKRNLYTVESIYDYGVVFPLTDIHTSERNAIEEAKWNFDDGAKCVRVLKHIMCGINDMEIKEILRLEKQN